jgi:hypothetical protein
MYENSQTTLLWASRGLAVLSTMKASSAVVGVYSLPAEELWKDQENNESRAKSISLFLFMKTPLRKLMIQQNEFAQKFDICAES